MYLIDFTEDAKSEIVFLKKTDILAYKKLVKLLEELQKHPTTGTGKPEKLKYNYSGLWSRRINQKHRLVYSVDTEKIVVLVISAIKHYGD